MSEACLHACSTNKSPLLIVHQPSNHAYRSEETFNSRADYAASRGIFRECAKFDGVLCYGT
jgi:hypothetical protein